MSLLPTMVYRSPGIFKKPNGGTYTYFPVETQEQLDEMLSDGWFKTSAEAVEAAGDKATPAIKPKPKWATPPITKKKLAKPLDWREQVRTAPVVKPVSDDAAPTRAELQAKAIELRIQFDGRTKDKKLGQLIEDKLSEKKGE
jgi:hypothetical protein